MVELDLDVLTGEKYKCMPQLSSVNQQEGINAFAWRYNVGYKFFV